MADPTTSARGSRTRLDAYVVMSGLALGVDVEDRSTDDEPDAVSLHIGDERLGVLLCGDLEVLQRLVDHAHRRLAGLRRRGPGGPA